MNFKKEKGFTLIELMLVVVIIVILATAILVSISSSRTKARINGLKTSLKGVMSVLVACNNIGINTPSGQEDGTKTICLNETKSYWPKLPKGYAYVVGGNYSYNCDFQVSTNGDSNNLRCTCQSQKCQEI